MTDRFQFHSASELAAGKVDAAAWIVTEGGTTHELELKLQRAEPAPPLYRITYTVTTPAGTFSERAYLHDELPAAQRQYANLRRRSPVPT